MTHVIAIANEKGGVGKTTTALSLGAALAELQQHVLVADLDPQANLTLSLGVHPSTVRRSVADVLLGNYSPAGVSRPTNVPNIDVIPSNQELILAERFLGVRDRYEHLLRQGLASASKYDVILLDCPPSLGPITRSALTAAHLLVIPTQCEYFSAHALRDMLELVRSIRQRTNPRLRYRVLLTMIDRRNRIHRSLELQVRQAFNTAVFQTAIEIDTRLRESPVFGQPITVYAPSSRGAQQYRALAEEMRQYVQESAAPASQPA
jgi:chromosome partitioning protein